MQFCEEPSGVVSREKESGWFEVGVFTVKFGSV